jgi:hypothetical protein
MRNLCERLAGRTQGVVGKLLILAQLRAERVAGIPDVAQLVQHRALLGKEHQQGQSQRELKPTHLLYRLEQPTWSLAKLEQRGHGLLDDATCSA